MANNYRPPGFQDLTPYLNVNDADAFITFLKAAFGADREQVYRTGSGKIGHAQINVGDSILEFADAGGDFPPIVTAFHFYVPDVDAVHQQALKAGAKEVMPPQDQDYGERSSYVKDPFGNNWYIATYKGGPAS